MAKLSIIVPCYNEEGSIPLFYETIKKVTGKMEVELELIFVDDGSSDKTLTIMKEYSFIDSGVKYISFSRNFGKESAMFAGLSSSTGDFVSILDVDLQQPPELLLDMMRFINEEGFDCVATKNSDKKGYPFFRKIFTITFYKIIAKLSQTEMVQGANDYWLMTRQVVDSVLEMKEYNRYSKGIFSFVGYKVKWIEFQQQKRIAGKTKWSFWKLFTYAIEGIVGFSTVPLVLSVLIGILLCIISLALLVVIVVKTIVTFVSDLLMLSFVLCLLFGIQFICIGILGEYIARIHLEVKNRPLYIVKESNVENK